MELNLDKRVSKKADEFAGREYSEGAYEREALSKGYYWGYKDAEEDLALTAGNIKRISDIIEQMQDEGRNSGFCPPDWWGTEMFYEEVLRRYNESKRAD